MGIEQLKDYFDIWKKQEPKGPKLYKTSTLSCGCVVREEGKAYITTKRCKRHPEKDTFKKTEKGWRKHG